MSGAPIAKAGDLRSEVYLAFVRKLRCSFCLGPGGEAHHSPGKGRSGITDDSKTVSVCRECHQRCEGATINVSGCRLEPITQYDQRIAVLETWERFKERATHEEWIQFGRDRARWQESRVFAEVTL